MKRTLVIMLFLLCLIITAAAAEELPQEITALLDGSTVEDYLLFDMPDGSREAFVILDEGECMYGFCTENGVWKCHSSGSAMNGYTDVSLTRQSPSQLRPNGVPYGDALGFDIVSQSGARLSYHYREGIGFTISGWYDPSRYQGAVMVQGNALEYYAREGSSTPEAVIEADDYDTLCFWIFDFENHPATPDEARELASIMESTLADAFRGYKLCFYEAYNDGSQAEACYARLDGKFLHIKRTEWHKDNTLATETNCLPIPLSPELLRRMETEPWNTLIDTSGYGSTFLSDAFYDPSLIPVTDKVIQSEVQEKELILLTEDASGSRCVQIITREDSGRYVISAATLPMPATCSLDLFHAGEGELSLDMQPEGNYAYYKRSADGQWQLVYSSVGYQLEYGRVILLDDENAKKVRIGTLKGSLLDRSDPFALPQDRESLYSSLDRSGWAVVSNPNPADRLHLRTKPDKKAESLGKFYNGTPVQVLSQKGDWSEVTIGQSGLRGWMMTRYLTSGQKMDSIINAFPQLTFCDEYDIERPAFTNKSVTERIQFEGAFQVIGLVENELYILLSDTGETGYVPQEWLFEGNG